MRHAIAQDRLMGIRDEDRALTSEGRKRMLKAAQGLRQWGLKVELCLSSPLVRAWETAEILQEHLPISTPIIQENSLVPGGSLIDFLQVIVKRPETHILATGHEPTLSSWIFSLLGCERQASIRMKKGALCHLSLDLSQNPPWVELIAHLPPRIMRGLG